VEPDNSSNTLHPVVGAIKDVRKIIPIGGMLFELKTELWKNEALPLGRSIYGWAHIIKPCDFYVYDEVVAAYSVPALVVSMVNAKQNSDQFTVRNITVHTVLDKYGYIVISVYWIEVSVDSGKFT
jgi:hypothetical protein